jgi:hypothetical protein
MTIWQGTFRHCITRANRILPKEFEKRKICIPAFGLPRSAFACAYKDLIFALLWISSIESTFISGVWARASFVSTEMDQNESKRAISAWWFFSRGTKWKWGLACAFRFAICDLTLLRKGQLVAQPNWIDCIRAGGKAKLRRRGEMGYLGYMMHERGWWRGWDEICYDNSGFGSGSEPKRRCILRRYSQPTWLKSSFRHNLHPYVSR